MTGDLTRVEFIKGSAAVAATICPILPSMARAEADAQDASVANLTAVELFAGIGGFRLACDSLGIKTIWANDVNENAVKVYKDRFGDREIVQGDINDLINEIPEHDILTGGFPCQPFSRAGKKQGIDDYRGTLFEAIVRIVQAKSPRHFFLENVNSLLFLNQGRHFRTILFALADLGYKIEWRVFNAAAFGLPQQRLRVIICGSRETRPNESHFMTTGDCAAMPEDVREIVSQPALWADIDFTKGKFPQWGMAQGGKCVAYDIAPPRNVKRERKLRDILQHDVPPEFDFTEGTLKRIEKSLFVNKLYNGVRILYNQGGGARMGYTIFGTDGLSPTLTASASRHYERYGIDGRFRRLMNVEYARLQGFPDDHCAAVSVYEQYRLYGNAVPPPLAAYAIERVVRKQVTCFEPNELPLFE